MNKEELEVQSKAFKAGAIGIILLSTTFYIVELAVLGVQNFGWFSIISLYCAIIYTYKSIRMPKKYHWFLGVIWSLATIACIINYVMHRF